MKKKVVKRVCMVMMTGVMLAGCGKSTEKPAEQEAPVEAQVEESADQAENKDQSAVDVTSVEATSEEDFVIEALDDGTVQITKYKGTDAEVVIPDTISGKKVTVIGGFHNDYLESVILPDSVIEISDEAFSECTNIKVNPLMVSLPYAQEYGTGALDTSTWNTYTYQATRGY